MKRLVLLLLTLVSPLVAQQTVPLPPTALPGTSGQVPQYTTPQGGSPVMKPSQITDNGTALLYKGVAVPLVAFPPGSIANLPGSPNLVFSFVATGDQAGNTIHDSSGSGNNVTTSYNAPPWTGTGWTMNNASNSGVNVLLPASVSTDYSYCATVFLPLYTNPAGNINPVNALGSTTFGVGFGWQFTTQFGGSGFNSTYGDWSRVNSFNTAAQPQDSGLHTKCWIEGRSSNATVDHFYQDGLDITGSGGTGSGDTNIGQWVLAEQTTAQSTPTWYYFAAWAAQLTAAQVQQASLAMTQAVAARGVQVTPQSTPTNAPKYVAVGDSITCCGGASTTSWYPSLVSISSTYGVAVNEGISGFPVIALNDQAIWRDTPFCHTGRQPTMVTLFAGTNDGFFAQYSAAVTFDLINGYAQKVLAAGCQVGVATMLSRTGGLDTFKNALNPLVRNGAANGGYFLIDTDDPNLQCDGCNTNGFFNTDHVHPLNTGQTLLAALFSNAINAYGIGAASAANPTAYVATTNTMLSADRFATMSNAAATATTLPDCLGVTGAVYQITNLGAGTVTFAGKASEAITGSATLAQNLVAGFKAQLISQAAAGCGWTRIQ